jgi:predicted DNA-binding transcriptional regulator YafY
VVKNQDGSIRVTLFATSEHWLGRLLVRLGPDTKVVSPRKWQKLRESTSSSILARYTS